MCAQALYLLGLVNKSKADSVLTPDSGCQLSIKHSIIVNCSSEAEIQEKHQQKGLWRSPQTGSLYSENLLNEH